MSRNASGYSDARELYELAKRQGWSFTNQDIQDAKFTFNHTGRISNLRQLGFIIPKPEMNMDHPMQNRYRIENPEHWPNQWERIEVQVIVHQGQREWSYAENGGAL